MSIRIMNKAWEFSQQKANALLVLVKLADNANDDGVAFPGIKYLMRHTKIASRSTMFDNLRKLEIAGEIIIQPKSGPHGTNTYFITVGMSLESVDEWRKNMSLPGREEIEKRSEKAILTNDGDEFGEENELEEVQFPYHPKNPEEVQFPYPPGTVSEHRGADFGRGGTVSVPKPSLTIIKPSINQLMATDEFLTQLKNHLKNQMPKPTYEKYVAPLAACERDAHLVLILTENPVWCNGRLKQTCSQLARGILNEPDIQVEFAEAVYA